MEGSKLSGLWKVSNLVALGMFHVVVAFGRRRINIIFTSFHFSPHKILFKHFFH
jgi:hypothetical protein